MVQPGPRYPSMSGGIHPPIYDHLRDKYGKDRIRWPILAYDLEKMQIRFIIIEVNSKNLVNKDVKDPFLGPLPFPEYKLDYTLSTREKEPVPLGHTSSWNGPSNILSPEYDSSYEFVTKHGGLYTIDIDYVWKPRDSKLKGLETTTFFMDMKSQSYAEYLVQKFIERRTSRKRAHQFKILSQASSEIGIQMSLVFFNVAGHSNIINTNGYTYSIELDANTAKELHSGNFVKGSYQKFSEWLESL